MKLTMRAGARSGCPCTGREEQEGSPFTRRGGAIENTAAMMVVLYRISGRRLAPKQLYPRDPPFARIAIFRYFLSSKSRNNGRMFPLR